MAEQCGCKGSRWCLICKPNNSSQGCFDCDKVVNYCYRCGCSSTESLKPDEHNVLHVCINEEQCCSQPSLLFDSANACSNCGCFSGVVIYKDFVDKDEEQYIKLCADQNPWALSQSGRVKQDYGPKVNFKKKKLRIGCFNGLPSWSKRIVSRIQALPHLDNFLPVELCNLDYRSSRGAAIEPHRDDVWLWGERLITLNLLSGTILTFSCECGMVELRVPLPRQSLVIVGGLARHKWLHSIKKEHISNRRIAVTLRELSAIFLPSGQDEKAGEELLTVASSYSGTPVNNIESNNSK